MAFQKYTRNLLYTFVILIVFSVLSFGTCEEAPAELDPDTFTLAPIVSSSISVSSSVHEFVNDENEKQSVSSAPISNYVEPEPTVGQASQATPVPIPISARPADPQLADDELEETVDVSEVPPATVSTTPTTTTTTTTEVPFVPTPKPGPQLPVAEIYLAGASDELTLLTNVSNRAIFIDKSYLFRGSEFVNIVLVCSSSYPIRWFYDGDGAPTRMYSSELRTFGNFYNESTYEYFTTLVLMQERNNEHLTGTYSCGGTEYPNLGEVFYHLYFPGGYGFPTIRNRILRPPNNDTFVNLPCMATNPNLPMTLYKIYPKEEAGNLTKHEAVSYDPRIGFNLDLSRIETPFGTYYCSLNDVDSFWKIDLVPRKEDEVIVNPNTSLVSQESFSNKIFTCKARENIEFIFPQSVEYGTVQYFKNSSSEFPFVGVYTVNNLLPLASLSNYFKIQCVSSRTKRVLHTWEYSTIGSEELTIKYDSRQRRILCCSKSGLSTTQQLVKCETRSDCEIKKKCFENGRCEFPFPPKFTDAPKGCAAMEFLERVPTHVLKCSVGSLYSKIVAATETIDRNDVYMNEENSPLPSTELILKIVLLSQSANNEVKVKCSGSLYYFSSNFEFAVEKLNGSVEILNRGLVDTTDPYEPILATKIRRNVRRIYCYAPLAGSSEWRNASIPVTAFELTTTTTTTTTTGRSISRGSASYRGRTRLLG